MLQLYLGTLKLKAKTVASPAMSKTKLAAPSVMFASDHGRCRNAIGKSAFRNSSECSSPLPADRLVEPIAYIKYGRRGTFEKDPVLFNEGLKLVWHNFENAGSGWDGCPFDYPSDAGKDSIGKIEELLDCGTVESWNQCNSNPVNTSNATFVNLTTYAWVYEWPTSP